MLEDSEGGRERKRRDVLPQLRDKLYKEERVIRGISRIFTSAC